MRNRCATRLADAPSRALLTLMLQAASETQRPILLAIWLPGDEHNEEFRKIFDDERVERLSTSFHMVTVPWGEDSSVAKQWDIYPFVYATQMDGSYTPRVVFIHKGKAQLLTNRDLLNYRWYYYHPDSLVRSMEEAIEVFLHGAELKPPTGWVFPEEKPADAAADPNAPAAAAGPTPAPGSKPEGVKEAPAHPAAEAPPKLPKPKTLLERKMEMAKMAKELREEERRLREQRAKEEL